MTRNHNRTLYAQPVGKAPRIRRGNTMDAHRVFREFADSTSMHGVPRIINARSLAARIFWSIICLCAFGMFIWQTAILLQRYYSYPKKVNMEIVQSPVEFPWVSVCNTDHLDLLVVDRLEAMLMETEENTTEEDEEFLKWKDQYLNFWDSSSMFFQPYLMNFPQMKVKEDMLAVYSRLGLTANLGVDLASQGGIKKEDFIVSCRFSGEACNITTSFRKFFDPYYFNCFTFNSQSVTPVKANRLQGAEYGLTIILFMGSAGQIIAKGDVAFVIPGMEESDAALASGRGARIVVHSPNTVPTPASFGYDAPPGFSVTLGVKARENVRIGKPHGNCTEEIGNQIPKYSLRGCQNECMQQKIMRLCGCYDNKISIPKDTIQLPFCFQLPYLPDECLMEAVASKRCMQIMTEWSNMMNCRKEVYENMTHVENYDDDTCICYAPCNDIVYDASYSMTTIPENTQEHSAFYSVVHQFLENMSPPKRQLLDRKYGDYMDELGGYIARVNVYIADANVIKTTEAPDYESIRLISDIGGQLGLWIGISVMTLFEVIQLMADICRFITASSRKPRERPRSRPDRVADRDLEMHCEIDKLTAV